MDFTSCECSISTPMHSKSASGSTETNSSALRTRDWPSTRHKPSHTQTVLSLLQLAKSVPEAEYPTPLHSVS